MAYKLTKLAVDFCNELCKAIRLDKVEIFGSDKRNIYDLRIDGLLCSYDYDRGVIVAPFYISLNDDENNVLLKAIGKHNHEVINKINQMINQEIKNN